jgi:hypothetical protein
MSAALLIASLSFSVQLPKYLPKSLRLPWLLALPLLAVVVTMLYWLWRVRVRRPVRGMMIAAPQGALVTGNRMTGVSASRRSSRRSRGGDAAVGLTAGSAVSRQQEMNHVRS